MAGNGNLPPGYDGLAYYLLPGHERMGASVETVLFLAGIKIVEADQEPEVNKDQLKLPDLEGL